MAYTPEEQTQLNTLTAAYNKALEDYNAEVAMNKKGHEYELWSKNTGQWIFPYSGVETDQGSFYNWLAISDASATNATNAFYTAKTLLTNYTKQLTDKYITNNTALQTTVQSAAVQAAEQAKADIEKNLADKSFIQGTTKYFIYGTIALVLIIGTIIVIRARTKIA